MSEAPGRSDFYAELMREARRLTRDQTIQQQRWLDSLPWEHKEETLFELEMLLKGLVCLGNLDNHPGPPGRGPALARNFREEMRVMRAGCERTTELCRLLMGERDRPLTFQRYLESVMPQDRLRGRLMRESLEQDTPEQSLSLLDGSVSNLSDVFEGLSRLSHVPHRIFASSAQLVQREVSRSVYFDPLVHLEIHPLLDTIRSVTILEIVQAVESEAVQRIVLLSLLGLQRLLRYVAHGARAAESPGTFRLAYVALAVARSDARALSLLMRRDAPTWLARGFERDILAMRASDLVDTQAKIGEDLEVARDLCAVMRMIGDQLGLELRRAFEQQLHPIDVQAPYEDLAATTRTVMSQLGGFAQQGVVQLLRVFRPEVDGQALFDDFVSKRAQSERLRKDIWMFAQILRGFLAKARAGSSAANRWAGYASFRFVREFITYFRNLGYRFLRYSDYDRFDQFMALVDSLSDSDVLDTDRLEAFVLECEAFQGFLVEMFEAIGRREELRSVDFDRREAAETLKLYLER